MLEHAFFKEYTPTELSSCTLRMAPDFAMLQGLTKPISKHSIGTRRPLRVLQDIQSNVKITDPADTKINNDPFKASTQPANEKNNAPLTNNLMPLYPKLNGSRACGLSKTGSTVPNLAKASALNKFIPVQTLAPRSAPASKPASNTVFPLRRLPLGQNVQNKASEIPVFSQTTTSNTKTVSSASVAVKPNTLVKASLNLPVIIPSATKVSINQAKASSSYQRVTNSTPLRKYLNDY